jgi:hypothetical protein
MMHGVNIDMLGWGMGTIIASPFVIVALLWTLFWKGLALWHASKENQGVWFIILLILNTLGIVEIFYLFVILKKKPEELFRTMHAHSHHKDA